MWGRERRGARSPSTRFARCLQMRSRRSRLWDGRALALRISSSAMRGVLALWMVCALGATAGAVPANEATVQAVLDAVATQDTAVFARLVRRDVSLRSIWFE